MAPPYQTITSDYPRPNVGYASITLTLSGGLTDYDVKANTALFDRINYGREFVLRNIGDVSIKFNDPLNDSIDLYTHEGINMSGVPVSNIYITTYSGNVLVRVWMVGWN